MTFCSPYLRFDRPCSLLITVGDQPLNNDTDLSLGFWAQVEMVERLSLVWLCGTP